MKNYYLFICLAALLALSSCSTLRIEKRHYNKGWYVDFGTDKKHEAAPENTAIENEAPEAKNVTEATAEPQEAAAPAAAQQAKQQDATAVANAPSEQPAVDPASTDGQKTVDHKPSDKKEVKKSGEPAPGGDAETMFILLVILAILLPPLAVYLKQGVTGIFWITLICWLFGGFFFFGPWGYGYLGGLGLLAVVLALLVVFDVL